MRFDDTVRIASLLLVPLLACASTEPPPKAEVAAAQTVEPASTDVQPQAAGRVEEIRLSCALAITPASASDGRRVLERAVEVRHDFARVTTQMSGPPDRAHVTARSAEDLARVRALAVAVAAHAMPEAKPPVPDGQVCRLQIAIEGAARIDAPVDPQPPSAPLAALVLELRRWMQEPEPVWPTTSDPEVAACRGAARRMDVDELHVREIVIEADGSHRWEFVATDRDSSDNHFGCRITNGEPHILPEG